MRHVARMMLGVALVAATGVAIAQRGAPARAPELAYQVTEGQNINAFVRDGAVAAHLLLRNGNDPRILVAFPAGNSGAGQWFARLDRPATWRLEQAPRAVTMREPEGARTLHGIVTEASIDTPRLTLAKTVLSSIRFLRDYQSVGRIPAEVEATATAAGNAITAYRRRLDGAPGYFLRMEVLDGSVAGTTIRAGRDGRIRLRITAATGETPLTGLATRDLLNMRAANDPVAREALHFLSYREKFLAGSWRFQTYFGRDTLMSVRLLMPVLQPGAVEAGLGSVLARLDARGDVAHEEGIGEFAVVDRRQHGGSGDAAVLDYAMVDDDYMLAPVAAAYLLDHADRAAARRFLARPMRSEGVPGTVEPAGRALVRNLRYVLSTARPFAQGPAVERLIALKPGRLTGQWRDSEEGLGRGRYAYDVNAVFVPAALDAAARMLRAGLLDAYLTPQDRAALTQAAATAAVWRERAPALFRVDIPAAQASARGARLCARAEHPRGTGARVARERAAHLPCAVARRAGEGGADRQFGRGVRADVRRSVARGAGNLCHRGDAAVPGGADDRHRHAGRQCGAGGCDRAGPLHPRCLSRRGGVVVAAGAVRRRAGAAAGAARPAGVDARGADARAGDAVARDPGDARDAELRTVVLGL
ncbi:MAG: hypothetical protein PGN23_00130 [Sphingomonas adhaesiva]|uniref:hypothetical protein n=1 Tax=Sphingomonas adhaesiva TaxID=28212 RepID=UPI002FFC55DD